MSSKQGSPVSNLDPEGPKSTTQDDLADRLAKINAAVAEATTKQLKGVNPSQALASGGQPFVCPIDPAEREQCFSCQ